MKRPNKISWKYWKSSTMLPSINLFGSCVSVHKAAVLPYQLSTFQSTARWYDFAFKKLGMKTDTLGKTNKTNHPLQTTPKPLLFQFKVWAVLAFVTLGPLHV